MYKIEDVNICGVASTVPSKVINNLDLVDKYKIDELEKIISNVGVKSRHIVDNDITTSDLCLHSAEKIINHLDWEKDSIGALLFVSQTPDYQLPATACILHGKLGLSNSCISLDINLGCSGYIYGLHIASTLIATGVKRVLLLVGDTISRLVKSGDRSTELLFGDAGTATAIEFKEGKNIYIELGTDGLGYTDIIAREKKKNTSDCCNKGVDHSYLEMNGGNVFSFTLKRVPNLINKILSDLGIGSHEIDMCVYHQANQFMIKHLAKKSFFSDDQIPLSLSQYGNTSGASIPLTLCSNRLRKRSKVLMVGFGVGLSWGAAYSDLSKALILPVYEV